MRKSWGVAAALLGVLLAGCSRVGTPQGAVQSAAEDQKTEVRRVTPKIERRGDTHGHFEVRGLPQATLEALRRQEMDAGKWAAVFAVSVDGKGPPRSPPLAGSYRIEDGVIRFEPRYPLLRGVRYRAALTADRLSAGPGEQIESASAVFELPRPEHPPTVVDHVYPSRGTVPENLLKFYIHFSAPMSRGEAYEHVRLLDAAGKPVEAPFLELREELWDGPGRRFTLFFDPGRIKRGLKPREEVGPALEEGKSYTLVVDRAWPDAQGDPLKEAYKKAFRVTAPDEHQPDPKQWKVRAPAADTKDKLVVTFPGPLDHAMLERVLWVSDDRGQEVEGAITVGDEETRWEFTPKLRWRGGAYNLVAETTLEDLAGNSIARPFEVDVFHPIQRRVETKMVKVPFEVRANSKGASGGR
jgi:hypothetical protein